MSVDLSELDIGFVVSLGTLREVLQVLNIDGRQWWLASDPKDAADTGYVIVGHGCRGCVDRLNTLHFRVAVVGNEALDQTDKLILLVDPSTVTAEEPGFYLQDGSIVEDPVEDFGAFYEPLKRALIARLQSAD